MGEDRRRKRIQKEQHAYVDRLRHYRNKGIDIFIDGKMTRQEREWYRIFEVAFFLGYFVISWVG